MASIKDVLLSYGSAARDNYPQGDEVEDAMDCIASFIGQHGYEFEADMNDFSEALSEIESKIPYIKGLIDKEESMATSF